MEANNVNCGLPDTVLREKTPKFLFIGKKAFFDKKLFLSTFSVPKKGFNNRHLHNEGQKNLGTLIKCSLSFDVKGKMTKIGQKFFLKMLLLQQVVKCYKNDRICCTVDTTIQFRA